MTPGPVPARNTSARSDRRTGKYAAHSATTPAPRLAWPVQHSMGRSSFAGRRPLRGIFTELVMRSSLTTSLKFDIKNWRAWFRIFRLAFPRRRPKLVFMKRSAAKPAMQRLGSATVPVASSRRPADWPGVWTGQALCSPHGAAGCLWPEAKDGGRDARALWSDRNRVGEHFSFP